MPIMMRRAFIVAFVTVSLSACGGDVLPPLPDGEQTITGILKQAELSAVRRGSHLLEQDGIDVYYTESSLINLREYQGKRVTLRGVLEHNTEPDDLPVLVVESVVDVEDTSQEHNLSAIGVRITTPVQWKMVKREGKYQFRQEEDSEDPLLVVWQEEGDTLPDGGVPVVIDATRATKLVDDLSGTQIVVVKRDGALLTVRFSPGQRLNAERLREIFADVLQSIELTASATDSSEPTFGTGSLSTPCGGTAGILCPEGYFCDIQDFEENIGRCRKL